MSCMSAVVTPVKPGITQAISTVGGIESNAYIIHSDLDADATADRVIKDINASIDHLINKEEVQIVKNRLSVTITLTCSVSISKPYLEIDPEILWIWSVTGDNDVYSNTVWSLN